MVTKEKYEKPIISAKKIVFESFLMATSSDKEDEKEDEYVWCEKHQRYEKSGSNHGIGGVEQDALW